MSNFCENSMTPDTHFESISFNLFTVNDTDIHFYSDISPLSPKWNVNPNGIHEGFECVCKNGFSVSRI